MKWLRTVLFLAALMQLNCQEKTYTIKGVDAASLPVQLTGAKSFSIAFGSCLSQKKPMPIWAAISQQKPQLMLLLGDNVYGDSNEPGLPELKAAYFKQQQNLNQLDLQMPIWAIWDDHDYGLDDGGADFRYKKQAKALFLDFFQVPKNDPRQQRDGLYFAKKLRIHDRNIKFIFLDTRSFRGPLQPTDSRGATGKERYLPAVTSQSTMLGSKQWQWLTSELLEEADLLVLVSSIQVIAEGHGFERWGLLPKEQQRLYSALANSKASRILALSGDRHRAGIYRVELPAGKELWEMTSSSLNKPSRHDEEPGPFRRGVTFRQENFGLIRLNTEQSKIFLQIHDKTGQKVLAEEITW